jgi:hypothetical protein
VSNTGDLLKPGFAEDQLQSAVLVVRAVGPRRMSGCGPGARATCSAVLSGALEAYPPLGTTPGVLGGGAGGGLPHISWPKI